MNNIFFNSNYSFNLRKDVKDTSQARLINILLLNAYMSRGSLATAKAFINTTISNLSNLNTVVDTKPGVAQINNIVQSTVQEAVRSTVQETVQEAVRSTVQSTVQEAVRSTVQEAVQEAVRSTVQEAVQSTVQEAVQSTVQEAVQSTVQEAVSNVMDAQIQQAISAINIEKQNAINVIHSYNGAGINESIQSAITQLNDKTQVVLNDINSLAESVSYQISNMNAYTKEELLQKIDFLFEMFYHADSATIIELYPL